MFNTSSTMHTMCSPSHIGANHHGSPALPTQNELSCWPASTRAKNDVHSHTNTKKYDQTIHAQCLTERDFSDSRSSNKKKTKLKQHNNLPLTGRFGHCSCYHVCLCVFIQIEKGKRPNALKHNYEPRSRCVQTVPSNPIKPRIECIYQTLSSEGPGPPLVRGQEQ